MYTKSILKIVSQKEQIMANCSKIQINFGQISIIVIPCCSTLESQKVKHFNKKCIKDECFTMDFYFRTSKVSLLFDR